MRHSIHEPGNATTPKVAVILLNWNGWKNTIECLESVFRLSYPAFTVIVCDNASTDGSVDRICAWAEGCLPASCSSADLTRLVVPAVPKPIESVRIDPRDTATNVAPGIRLVLIPTGANLGFAGGNNVGLRFALSWSEIEYFWLLNNDTLVEPDALSAMVGAMQADRGIGLCGSVLRDYFFPGSVLTLGGRKYNRWSGRSRPIQAIPNAAGPQEFTALDYVEAASVLVRRGFLERVGLMSEDYFLYFEEMDWAMRARGRFGLAYSPQSIVYHKEGGSIGSHKDRNQRSPLTDYYQARNRLVFTRRYFPWLLPSMFVSVAATAAHRLLSGRRQNATAVIKGMLAGWKPRSVVAP
jgi:GT2 family glycosyltransferase